jgi:hypothetical protein
VDTTLAEELAGIVMHLRFAMLILENQKPC